MYVLQTIISLHRHVVGG